MATSPWSWPRLMTIPSSLTGITRDPPPRRNQFDNHRQIDRYRPTTAKSASTANTMAIDTGDRRLAFPSQHAKYALPNPTGSPSTTATGNNTISPSPISPCSPRSGIIHEYNKQTGNIIRTKARVPTTADRSHTGDIYLITPSSIRQTRFISRTLVSTVLHRQNASRNIPPTTKLAASSI